MEWVKKCKDCNCIASYGFNESTHCRTHASLQMRKQKNKCHCGRDAIYGYKEHIATHCDIHKTYDQYKIRDYSVTCLTNNCMKVATFHLPNMHINQYCSEHKLYGMWSSVYCNIDGCNNTLKDCKLFCNKHNKNKVQRCGIRKCVHFALYGFICASHCYNHKTSQMIQYAESCLGCFAKIDPELLLCKDCIIYK